MSSPGEDEGLNPRACPDRWGPCVLSRHQVAAGEEGDEQARRIELLACSGDAMEAPEAAWRTFNQTSG